jgi:hypothetical protein
MNSMARHSVRPGFPPFPVSAQTRSPEPRHARKSEKRRRVKNEKELTEAAA